MAVRPCKEPPPGSGLRPDSIVLPARNPAWLFILLAVAASLAITSPCCTGREEPKKVSLAPAAAVPGPPDGALPAPGAGGRPLRMAIAAMVSPKETFTSYHSLVRYIGKKLGREVELVQRKSYEEVNTLLKKDLLDVAFVCTGAYVDGHDEFDMELLVAPVVQGRTVYYSYVIVPEDSPVRSFEELRGKTFAFTDPLSNTGRLAPAYRLAQLKETPDRFFKDVVYTYSHDRSIESVARKLVDGAAVDSLVWDAMRRKNPEFTSRTRIVDRSDAFGIPPIVVSRAVEPALKRKLRDLLLHAHEDEEGKEILSGIMVDRFVVVDDGIYDSVRAMRRLVGGNAGK